MGGAKSEYESLSNDEFIAKFEASADKRLSSSEAQKRLSENTPNASEEKKQSKWMILLRTLIICGIILAVSIYRLDVSHSVHESFGEIAIFILVHIIARNPLAFPAVLSVTMVVCAHKMTKLKAIVAKLTSIEELANLNVLCSDKTGPLTKGGFA